MNRNAVSSTASDLRNALFANHARRFVNRVARLPGLPILVAGGAVGTVVMTTVGAFGTGAIPLTTRAGFWLALIGWNMIKWQAWFAWLVRKPSDWMAASLSGAIALNLSLPFEIAGALRLFGLAGPRSPLTHTWLEALAISGAILAIVVIVRRLPRSEPRQVQSEPSAVDPNGILARSGVRDARQLAGFEAEDHFCRLYLVDGRSVLIHARFGDLLREVDDWDGAQIHRGSWVSGRAVCGAVRSGRRWLMQIKGVTELPVSARYLPVVRSAGWLHPPLKTTPQDTC